MSVEEEWWSLNLLPFFADRTLILNFGYTLCHKYAVTRHLVKWINHGYYRIAANTEEKIYSYLPILNLSWGKSPSLGSYDNILYSLLIPLHSTSWRTSGYTHVGILQSRHICIPYSPLGPRSFYLREGSVFALHTVYFV